MIKTSIAVKWLNTFEKRADPFSKGPDIQDYHIVNQPAPIDHNNKPLPISFSGIERVRHAIPEWLRPSNKTMLSAMEGIEKLRPGTAAQLQVPGNYEIQRNAPAIWHLTPEQRAGFINAKSPEDVYRQGVKRDWVRDVLKERGLIGNDFRLIDDIVGVDNLNSIQDARKAVTNSVPRLLRADMLSANRTFKPGGEDRTGVADPRGEKFLQNWRQLQRLAAGNK